MALFRQHSESEHSLFLFLRFALAAWFHLICILLRLSVHLVLGEEQDAFSLILHSSHVCFLTFSLSPLEVRNRYISITKITCGED